MKNKKNQISESHKSRYLKSSVVLVIDIFYSSKLIYKWSFFGSGRRCRVCEILKFLCCYYILSIITI